MGSRSPLQRRGCPLCFISARSPVSKRLKRVLKNRRLEDRCRACSCSRRCSTVTMAASASISVRLDFSPPLLLRLLRLAYQHVRREDDAHHEGSYSPDTRDHAEKSRNAVLSALLSTTGPEGWAVKLEMAADPLFAHMKRPGHRARGGKGRRGGGQSSRLQRPSLPFWTRPGSHRPQRAKRCSRSCGTGSTISMIFCSRTSRRAQLWASITDEHVMRRELARALRDWSNAVLHHRPGIRDCG